MTTTAPAPPTTTVPPDGGAPPGDGAPSGGGRFRRRPARVAALLAAAAAVIAGGVAAGLAIHLRGGAATPSATVPLELARARDAPEVRVENLQLDGSERVTLPALASTPPAAPLTANLGIVRVPARDYTAVRAVVDGEPLVASIRAALHDGGLHPLLVVVAPHHLDAYWGNEAVNQGLALAAGEVARLPDVTFHDQAGRAVTTAQLRGRVVVAAALDTACSDTCPLYTAVLQDLGRVLRARGWDDRVSIVDISMDPARDTAAELAAYAARFGAPWELLAADPTDTQAFWSALHYSYVRLPTDRGTVDWYTGAPETYHLHHDSVALVVDAQGYVRANLQGIPRLGHGLSPALQQQLAPSAQQATQEQAASWTVTDLLDRVDTVLGEPAEADRGVEHAARVGEHAPDFSLPATASGGAVTLHGQLGHPVVVNFFASWCEPCRTELPLLAAVGRAHPEVTVLAVDEGESAAQATAFLDAVLGRARGTMLPVLDADRSVGGDYAVTGMPVSVFVDSDGTVRAQHVGQLDDATLQAGLRAIG